MIHLIAGNTGSGKTTYSNELKRKTIEFEVSKENFCFMESWFEKPNDSEMKNSFLITE